MNDDYISAAEVDGAVNRRERDNLLVRKGGYHLPGLRYGDWITAGQVAYAVEVGEASLDEWYQYVADCVRERRMTDMAVAGRPPKVKGK